MTADRERCGLGSLIPMSCRGRAEAFARRLRSRLKSLGSSNEADGDSDEHSWLTKSAPSEPSSVSSEQPRHSSSSDSADLFLDFGLLESPGSPAEEAHRQHRPFGEESNDSSSDGTYYDLDGASECGWLTNGEVGRRSNGLSDDGSEKGSFDSVPSSECNNVISYSDGDESTLSLPDEDYASSFEAPPVDPVAVDRVDFTRTNGEVYCSQLNVQSPFVTEVTLVDLEGKEFVDEATSTEEDATSEKLEETHDYDSEPDERPHRVRRCSSLKTGKTPPGTPGRKKIVRFADVLGLDLADVRTFLDEIPKIPNSAYEDLKEADLNDSPSETTSLAVVRSPKPDKMIMPLFQQPGGLPNFLDRVRERQVCLENAVVTDPAVLAISGTVRVRNLDFHKSVHIRYTLDLWKTYADLQATYVQNSCDGFSDKFSFVLYANNLPVGQRLEFAVKFHCKGCIYWDSNNGTNYCFQCLPTAQRSSITPIAATNDDWRASFY